MNNSTKREQLNFKGEMKVDLTKREDMVEQIKKLLDECILTDGSIDIDYEYGKADIRIILKVF